MEKIAGLLLQAIPYLEEKKILKILTEKGLITLLSNRKIAPILTSGFIWAEWVYKISPHPIPFVQEAALLEDFSEIKQTFARITIAGQIAKDLLRTQFPGKRAHAPLILALAYLRKLPFFSEPMLLGASFRLKLLLCEGMLDPEELDSSYLQILGLSRSFQEIAKLSCVQGELDKIETLFMQSTQ